MNNRIKEIIRFYVNPGRDVEVVGDDQWETEDLEELREVIIDILLARAIHGKG